jgi:serine/threonine protein kinase
MKEIDLAQVKNQNFEVILMEINACYLCKHENIVKYVDHYYDEEKDRVCLVLELCKYGSLIRVLKKFKEDFPSKYFPEEVIYLFIYLFIYLSVFF